MQRLWCHAEQPVEQLLIFFSAFLPQWMCLTFTLLLRVLQQELFLYLLGLFYWTRSAQNIPIKVLICWFWGDSYKWEDGKSLRLVWVWEASILRDSSVATWRQRASACKEHEWRPLREGMKWGNEWGKVTAQVRGSDHLQLYSGFQFIHSFCFCFQPPVVSCVCEQKHPRETSS